MSADLKYSLGITFDITFNTICPLAKSTFIEYIIRVREETVLFVNVADNAQAVGMSTWF